MKAFRWVIVAAIAGNLLVLTASAAAGGDVGAMTVRGTQIIVDEKQGRYAMRGDLVGKWNVTAFTLNYGGADGQVVGSGKETFSGCHDADRSGSCNAGEPTGTLRFTFVYWATYKPGTETLVKGQCVHPVIGGTGGFAKAKGVIHMKDTPSGNGVRTTYLGTIQLSTRAAASRTESSTTSTAVARNHRAVCGS